MESSKTVITRSGSWLGVDLFIEAKKDFLTSRAKVPVRFIS